MQGVISPATTAGGLGIWHVLPMLLVGAGPVEFKTNSGDGGNQALARRIHMRGNLTENVSLFLILLVLLELSGRSPLFVVLHICPVYGLSMHFPPGPKAFRAIGVGGRRWRSLFGQPRA